MFFFTVTPRSIWSYNLHKQQCFGFYPKVLVVRDCRLDCSFEHEKKWEEWTWRFQNCCLSLQDQKPWCNWLEGQFKSHVFHHLSPLSFKQCMQNVILSCYRSPQCWRWFKKKDCQRQIKVAETELKFIEFLNMSHYSNTLCVIPDLQHKRQPLCKKYRCLFHSWWMMVVALQPFRELFSFSSSADTGLSTKPACLLQPSVHPSHSDQPRSEVVTEIWGVQEVFQVLWHCSMKRSFAKLTAGFCYCCESNFEMFFSYILPYKMVPGWKLLYAP